MIIKILIAIIAVSLILTGIFTSLVLIRPDTQLTTATEQSLPLDATVIFNLVNDKRVEAGLQPLVRDARLDATAQERALDMTNRNYYGHYDPVTGESMVKIKPTNPECVVASENIDDAVTNEEAITEWMNSKPHHDAMLDSKYTLTGVAVKGRYIVQHFCQQ